MIEVYYFLAGFALSSAYYFIMFKEIKETVEAIDLKYHRIISILEEWQKKI